MNNSFRIMQRRFFEEQGEIPTFEDLGHAFVRHIDAQARAERRYGQLTDNRLLGLSFKMSYTQSAYIGKSVLQREFDQRRSGERDTVGYSGKIWLRFLHELADGFNALNGCMLHIGTGGYSTWEGPWQELGISLQKHEQGVPWNLRQELACYTFSSQIYLSDFPDLDQLAIMNKLGDQGMPKNITFFWQEDGLEERDHEYITSLQAYKERSYE